MLSRSSSVKLLNSSIKLSSFLSRQKGNVAPIPLASWEKEKEEFNKTLPSFINGILDHKIIADVPLASKRLRKALEHTLSSGRKRIRPMIFLCANKILTKPEHQTPDNMKLCLQLAWLTEQIHSSGSIVDDILDNSEVRENLPCWHLLPGVGNQVPNDVAMLIVCGLMYMNTLLGDRTCYKIISKSYVEVLLVAYMAQNVDKQTRVPTSGFDMFTLDSLKTLASIKIGQYTFSLPINWVLFINNCHDDKLHKQVDDIAGEIGYIYQSRNDILDCYGEGDTGRAGVDIQNGALTWLAIKALELASPSQLADFKSCYGKKDPECVATVKRLYQTLDLQELFKEEESQTHQKILEMAQELPNEFLTLYATILDRIIQRKI